MSARPVTLSAAEREEHRQLLFECEQSGIALNAYLAELLVLRTVLSACRRAGRWRLPGALATAMDRIPARSPMRAWAQEVDERPVFDLDPPPRRP